MSGRIRMGMIVGTLGLVLPGCASPSDARYVYQDAHFGVVAIPENTPQGSHHYREQAEDLMARHFPQGYEIVRAEEVVAGTRTRTVGRSGTTELAPQVAPHLLACLRVGGTMSRSQADTLPLTECRIVYKKAEPESATGPGGFAPEPSLMPTCYRDPKDQAPRPDKEPARPSQAKPDPDAAQSHANADHP